VRVLSAAPLSLAETVETRDKGTLTPLSLRGVGDRLLGVHVRQGVVALPRGSLSATCAGRCTQPAHGCCVHSLQDVLARRWPACGQGHNPVPALNRGRMFPMRAGHPRHAFPGPGQQLHFWRGSAPAALHLDLDRGYCSPSGSRSRSMAPSRSRWRVVTLPCDPCQEPCPLRTH
jgi:hypothetical protein